MEGKLHVYHPKRGLVLFEHTQHSPSSSGPIQNVLLFIGGLYDNLRSTGYSDDLSRALSPSSSWTFAQIQLSSANRGWGMSDLDKDTEEIGVCVDFIRSSLGTKQTNIVLMGHSTGCQDILHYIHFPLQPSRTPHPPSGGSETPKRLKIQGAILQAPVSDREQFLYSLSTSPGMEEKYVQVQNFIASTPEDEYTSTILPFQISRPVIGPVPITIMRYLSLVSPDSPQHPGPDDLFSSDLTDQRLKETFGRIGRDDSPLLPSKSSSGKPTMLILMSGSDEFVPTEIDKSLLFGRWKTAIESGNARLSEQSQIVDGGKHDLSGSDNAAKWGRLVEMRKSVLMYLDEVVGDVGQESWAILKRDEEDLRRERDGVKL